jgi:hypothetical protein
MVTQDQLTEIDFVENCPGKPAEKVKSRIITLITLPLIVMTVC